MNKIEDGLFMSEKNLCNPETNLCNPETNLCNRKRNVAELFATVDRKLEPPPEFCATLSGV